MCRVVLLFCAASAHPLIGECAAVGGAQVQAGLESIDLVSPTYRADMNKYHAFHSRAIEEEVPQKGGGGWGMDPVLTVVCTWGRIWCRIQLVLLHHHMMMLSHFYLTDDANGNSLFTVRGRDGPMLRKYPFKI